MSIYDPDFELIMYVSLVLFITSGFTLLGMAFTGIRTDAMYATRFIVVLVWVSALFAGLGALGVIFGGG